MALSQLRSLVGAPSQRLDADSYLTDGVRLLRVVSRFEADARSACAWLEDCLTLEVRPYSPRELGAMRLRAVRASPSD